MTRHWTWLLMAALAVTGVARAQEEPPPPDTEAFFGEPPPDDMLMPPPAGEPPPEQAPPEPGGPGDGPPPVEQWLQHLQQENPAEFESLRKLREDDPQAFRHALHRRLLEQRLTDAVAAYPKLQEAFQSMPEEERIEALRKLIHIAGPPGMRRGPGGKGPGFQGMRGGGPGKGSAVRKLEEEAGELARSYQKADDEAAREKIKAELRAKLEQVFDTKEQERLQHIERAEKEMTRLKEMLETRRASRDEIIDRRLKDLTDDNALKW